MKKRILAVILAVAMGASVFGGMTAVASDASTAPTQEIVESNTNLLYAASFDVSFENGTYAPEGWTQGQVTTDKAHTGEKSLLKKDSWGPGAHIGFYGVELLKGKEYTLSFWFYSDTGANSTGVLASTSDSLLAIEPATGCNVEYGALTWQDKDGNDVFNNLIWNSNDADGSWYGKNAGAWTYVERKLKPTEDFTGFKLQFSGESPVYYDDFCLVEVTEAPTPDVDETEPTTTAAPTTAPSATTAIPTPDVDETYPPATATPTAAATATATPTAAATAPATLAHSATASPGNVSGNFQYEIIGGAVSITKYLGKESIVDIPEKINGRTVTSIGESAFKNNQVIQSVILPDTIEEIGEKAFESCDLLSNVSFKENLKTIGRHAFFNCQSLTMVIIPKSVTSIGQYAFGYDSAYNTILGFTITGFGNTAAEEYANDNGLNFNSLGDAAVIIKKSIKFTKKSVKIKKGKKVTLKVKITGAKKATFSVDKKGKKVVKLSKKKAKSVVVTGKKKGKAIITAKAAGKKATCKVTVK